MSGKVLLTKWVRRIKRVITRPVLWVPVVLLGVLTFLIFVVRELVVWVVVNAYETACERGAETAVALVVATTFAGMLGTTIVFGVKRIVSWVVKHLFLWAERAIRDRTVDLDSGVVGRDEEERERIVANSVAGGRLSRWLSFVFVTRAGQNDHALARAMVECRSAQRDYKKKLEYELDPGVSSREESEETRKARVRFESAWSEASRLASGALDDNGASYRIAGWSQEILELAHKVNRRRQNVGGGLTGLPDA